MRRSSEIATKVCVSDRALAGKQMPAMTSSEASPMMAIAGLFLTFRFSQDATARPGTRLYKIGHASNRRIEVTRNSTRQILRLAMFLSRGQEWVPDGHTWRFTFAN